MDRCVITPLIRAEPPLRGLTHTGTRSVPHTHRDILPLSPSCASVPLLSPVPDNLASLDLCCTAKGICVSIAFLVGNNVVLMSSPVHSSFHGHMRLKDAF